MIVTKQAFVPMEEFVPVEDDIDEDCSNYSTNYSDDHEDHDDNNRDDHEYYHIHDQSQIQRRHRSKAHRDHDSGCDRATTTLHTDDDQKTTNTKTLRLSDPLSHHLAQILHCVCSTLILAITFFLVAQMLWSLKLMSFGTEPSFHVKSFTTSYFDMIPSSSSSSTPTLSAKWQIGFSTEIPTKAKAPFCFDNLEAAVYYGDTLLATSVMSPFCSQPSGAETILDTTFHTSQMIVKDSVATEILGDQALNNPVAFNVKIKGKAEKCPGLLLASHNSKYWSESPCKDGKYHLDVSCKDVFATVGNFWRSGRMSGESKQCKVVVSPDLGDLLP